jgi:hypothetical protein
MSKKNNKNEIAARTETYIEQFGEKLRAGVLAMYEAAQVYATAISADPEARVQFEARYPQITQTFWTRLELVGSGDMHNTLLLDSSQGGDRLRRLPVGQQELAINNGINVLSADGTALRVDYKNLTSDQIRMVFAGDHIRTLSEQRAWVESNKVIRPRHEPKRVAAPLSTRGDTLRVGDTEITLAEAARMIGIDGVMKMMRSLAK